MSYELSLIAELREEIESLKTKVHPLYEEWKAFQEKLIGEKENDQVPSVDSADSNADSDRAIFSSAASSILGSNPSSDSSDAGNSSVDSDSALVAKSEQPDSVTQ